MLAQFKTWFSSLSTKTRVFIGVGIIATVAISAGIMVLLDGPYVTLNASHPATLHPDGLAVLLGQGAAESRVQITTVPREAFIAGSAGWQWNDARAALPTRLIPLSPLYTLKHHGGVVIAEMAIPNGAEPLALLDLVQWDSAAKKWIFLPSRKDISRQVIAFTPSAELQTVMAVHVQPEVPAVGIVIRPGDPDIGANYGLSLMEGLSIDPHGVITGSAAESSASTVLPVIYNRTDSLPISDPAWQNNAVVQIQSLITPYDGVVIDINPGQGYGDFLNLLDKQVHAHGKRVDIVVRGLEFDSYDLPNLSRYADMIWFAPGDNPTLYLPGGPVTQALDVLVGLAGRDKVGLMVRTGNVDVVGNETHSVTLEEALLPFGGVQPIEGYLNEGIPLAPGDALALRLSGQVESFGFDEGLAMNYLTYRDPSTQVHYVYFASPQNLALKLSPALTYSLNTVAISGLSDSELPDHMVDGISAFLSNQSLGDPPPLELIWRVKDSAGADLVVDQGDLTLLQYLWQVVSQPGQYLVSAGLRHDQTESEISQLQIEVGNQVVVAATPTPTSTPPVGSTPKPGGTPTPTSQAVAAPVTGSIAAGAFELGGQSHGTGSLSVMHSAGMSWIKFQHKWGPGDDPSGEAARVAQAKAAGFKVLISVPGPLYPQSIEYGAYVNFLAGLAHQGVDGIEIWNEMNLAREWPQTEINGANYVTNMLAPAYQTLKAINPNILVISGAPAPTGAWGGCGSGGTPQTTGCDDWAYLGQMRDAGAANYMDCMGIHFNSGATSPASTTGHPADGGDSHYTWYYSKMVATYYSTIGKPLCFTELGYLSPDGYGGLPGNFWWGANTSVDEQAQWLAETAVMASQSGKVRLMIIFNVDFTVWESDDPQAGYAIIRPGGTCPACAALAGVQP